MDFQPIGDWWSQLKEPLRWALFSIALASPISALILARSEFRFPKMRRNGFTQAVTAIALTGAVTVGVLGLGTALIEVAHPDAWLVGKIAVIAAAALFIVVVGLHVWHRETVTLRRFINTIVIPLGAPAIPFLDVFQPLLGGV